jgi:hypothetical protein
MLRPVSSIENAGGSHDEGFVIMAAKSSERTHEKRRVNKYSLK